MGIPARDVTKVNTSSPFDGSKHNTIELQGCLHLTQVLGAIIQVTDSDITTNHSSEFVMLKKYIHCFTSVFITFWLLEKKANKLNESQLHFMGALLSLFFLFVYFSYFLMTSFLP